MVIPNAHRLRAGARVCSGIIIVLLVIAALGPSAWAPRTALGWQFDHFIGYFGITLFFCFAWPRPFVVAVVIMVVAALLEGLQAFTVDRSANVVAALCGAGGALAAALVAELFIQASRRYSKHRKIVHKFPVPIPSSSPREEPGSSS
jgi:VanZ family protein